MVLQSGPFDGDKQVPHRQSSVASAEVRCYQHSRRCHPAASRSECQIQNST